MNKALLTKQDVYDFICQAIQQQPRPLLNTSKLCNALKISRKTLNRLINRGLPIYHDIYGGHFYDYSEVVKWINDKDIHFKKGKIKQK